MTQSPRDHGGALDQAASFYGGATADWIDLSTGINPVPYPIKTIPASAWTALPLGADQFALEQAARRHWSVPEQAAVLAAPGASALIARIPALLPADKVSIPSPTYNEHAASFQAHGWTVTDKKATARVVVHPNNPTGQFHHEIDQDFALHVIDESFCDTAPDRSWISLATKPGTVILKSFGKFWGLAGLRLGFAIGDPDLIGRLAAMLGPWPVAGPALTIGTQALMDETWSRATRERLAQDAMRLDSLMTGAGAQLLGGTSLFRLYQVNNAAAWQSRLARAKIWSRIFPYSAHFLRLGLPAPDQWSRLEDAL